MTWDEVLWIAGALFIIALAIALFILSCAVIVWGFRVNGLYGIGLTVGLELLPLVILILFAAHIIGAV